MILKDEEIVKVEKQQYIAHISGPPRGILNRITVGVTLCIIYNTKVFKLKRSFLNLFKILKYFTAFGEYSISTSIGNLSQERV